MTRYFLLRTASGGFMSDYQLYCFAQSGNAYRAALMLNLIGADWEPVWYDFFGSGAAAHAGVSRRASTKWAKRRCWCTATRSCRSPA